MFNIKDGGRGPTVHQSPYNAWFHISKSVFFHHFKKKSPIIILGVGLDVAPRFCGNGFLFGKSTVLVNGVKQRCSHSFCKLSSGFVQMFMLSSHSSIGPKCSKRLCNNPVFIFNHVCFVLCTLPSCARQWIQKWQPSLDGPWWSVDSNGFAERSPVASGFRNGNCHWMVPGGRWIERLCWTVPDGVLWLTRVSPEHIGCELRRKTKSIEQRDLTR